MLGGGAGSILCMAWGPFSFIWKGVLLTLLWAWMDGGSLCPHSCFWGVMGRQQKWPLSPCTPAIAGAAMGLLHHLTSNHLSDNSSCVADVPQTLIDP